MIPSPKRQMFFVCSGNSKTLKHLDLRGKVAAVNEQAIILEQLEALKTRVMQIHADIPCIKESSLSLAAGLGDIFRLDVDFLAVPVGQTTAERMKAASEKGMRVYAWTVNDIDGILDLMEVGIDGVITDDPALARKAVEDIRKLSAMERLLFRFRHVWD